MYTYVQKMLCKHFWKWGATIFENDVQIKSGEARGGPQTLDQESRIKCLGGFVGIFRDLFGSPKKTILDLTFLKGNFMASLGNLPGANREPKKQQAELLITLFLSF